MITVPNGAQIWIAAGITDMRRGLTGLSALVQTALEQNPFGGHVFVFRGKRGDLIKVLWWDGDGLCRFLFFGDGAYYSGGVIVGYSLCSSDGRPLRSGVASEKTPYRSVFDWRRGWKIWWRKLRGARED